MVICQHADHDYHHQHDQNDNHDQDVCLCQVNSRGALLGFLTSTLVTGWIAVRHDHDHDEDGDEKNDDKTNADEKNDDEKKVVMMIG